MSGESSISSRIRELVGAQKVTAIAREWGIPATSLRQYMDDSIPGADKAAQIAAAAGVSLDWLVTGAGPQQRDGFRQSQSQSLVPADDLAMIPRLDVAASAGSGALADVEHHVGLVAFQADWLRRRGITPEAARALTARGDSMEPTIRSGDLLLVDTSIDHVRDNGIYVVILSGMVLVKRIHVRMDGSLRLISDNKDLYEPEEIKPDRVQDLAVAGRVMWYGRSI